MKNFISQIIMFPFKFIGLFSPLFRMLVIHGKLESLERYKRYEEARNLRHENITKFNKKYLAPLWRQEGFDLLYQIKDYQKSLEAFENAIETVGLSPALYGVANPLDIYFGASMAAVSSNNTEKAKKYYSEFSSLFVEYSKNPKLEKAMKNYEEGIKWIEGNLK